MRPRVIPVLLIDDGYVVKTTAFRKPVYVGDPINTVRIFNDKEVDELFVLDISRTKAGRAPDFDFIEDVVSEAFMPVAYGGGISSVDHAERLFNGGVEKIVLNEALFAAPDLSSEIASHYGAQAVVGNVDVVHRRRQPPVVARGGTKPTNVDPIDWARQLVDRGVGEILLTSTEREGSRLGYDLPLIASVSEAVSVPVVANGGAGGLPDFSAAIHSGASAVAAGTMFTFHGSRRAVLITYPTNDELTADLGDPPREQSPSPTAPG